MEHKNKLEGLTLVESWLIEDKANDKSNMYGMDLPLGTWMGTVKVDNDEIWNNEVKNGKIKGFSIEGYFADKAEMSKQSEDQKLLNELKDLLQNEK